MEKLDKRFNVFRAGLAEKSLRGRIEAERYVEGRPMVVAAPATSLRARPAPDAAQLTQALMGEEVSVFEDEDGWSWVKLARDGYVGYVLSADLKEAATPATPATHEVATTSTIVFPKADLKSQPAQVVPMLARLSVAGEDGGFARLVGGGYVYKRHLRPIDSGMGDFVSVAERFLFSPYYWGGKTVHGLDCSGLVQISLNSVGWPCLRDSDMQEETLGEVLATGTKLKRGDLVFWPGHVGIMADKENLLHANAFHMMVALEPLAAAIERIGRSGKPVSKIRRL